MKIGIETAAICGLFCGTCPSYPKECEGCLSQKLTADCKVCSSGFRECAKQHNVTRCWECDSFPCARLDSFSTKHIVNGICHHEKVITNLQDMKLQGVANWAKSQKEASTCPTCQKIIPWYCPTCPSCNNK